MAKSWYLITTPYNQVSGFENDLWNDSAQSAFSEVLQTSMADTVELCNFDLSARKKIRAVMQNSVQDTKLNDLTRHMLVPVGTCKAGMYVKYKGRYWLIVGLVDDNTMYEKAVLTNCNYKVSWIGSTGEVVSRWANITSAAQYNNGETYSRTYYTRSDQVLLILPDDPESLLLTNEDRFIIDRRCELYEKGFSRDVKSDTSNPVVTYTVTRADSVLYSYIDSGHQELMLTEDEQRDEDGYYVVNGKGYWLCQAPNTDDDDLSMAARIECNSSYLYNSLEPAVYTSVFYDENGKQVDVEPTWEINCAFKDKLMVEYKDNSIIIAVNNYWLVNRTFDLTVSADGYEPATMTITIKAFI